MCGKYTLILLLSGGTQSSNWSRNESRKSCSFAVEPEAIIEYGGVRNEEDVVSIKEGGNLDMELIDIEEMVADYASDQEEPPALAITTSGKSETTTGALDSKEKVNEDSTDSHGKDKDKESEDSGVTCNAASVKVPYNDVSSGVDDIQ